MHHPHFHSNMSHDKKATEQNKKEIFQYCRACYSPDQTLRPLKRPTLAEFAFEFYKLQARVRRTKKLWQITRLPNNGCTPFTYMYEPDGTLRTRLFDMPLQFWAKPKMIHRCTHCLTLTSLKCWYMPRCGSDGATAPASTPERGSSCRLSCSACVAAGRMPSSHRFSG